MWNPFLKLRSDRCLILLANSLAADGLAIGVADTTGATVVTGEAAAGGAAGETGAGAAGEPGTGGAGGCARTASVIPKEAMLPRINAFIGFICWLDVLGSNFRFKKL